MKSARLQDGSVIVEVKETSAGEVLLTVSKFNYDEDHVQVKLSRGVAAALAYLLKEMTYDS